MPREMPTTYKGLVTALHAAYTGFTEMEKGIRADKSESAAVKEEALFVVDQNQLRIYAMLSYLQETPTGDPDNQQPISREQLEQDQLKISVDPVLDRFCAKEESSLLIYAGLRAFAQAALTLRKPLPPQPLAKVLLIELAQSVQDSLGSVWSDSRNPAKKMLITYRQVLDGAPISFVDIRAHIEAVQNFVHEVTGYGGPSSGPSDQTITQQMGRLTAFGHSIMHEAESRLKPVSPTRAEPQRQRIFATVDSRL